MNAVSVPLFKGWLRLKREVRDLFELVLIPGLLSTIVTPFYRIIEFVIRGTASLILGIVF